MASLADLTYDDVVARSSKEPDWLRATRSEAFQALEGLAWPTPKDEDWRHTDPRGIPLDRPITALGGNAAPRTTGIAATVELPAGQAHIVNGRVVDDSVAAYAAEQGVVITDLASASGEQADLLADELGSVVGAEDAFAAANLAAFTGGVLVSVPANVELSAPIVVTVGVTEPGTHLPRLFVRLGENARADVYIERSGSAEATVVEVAEFLLADHAALRVASTQDWGAGVAHMGWHRGKLGRSADLRSLEATFGGDTVYIRPEVTLDGEGANGELYGVYYSSDDQRFEHRCLAHHRASHTTSDQVYKGAVQGTSRSVWYGNIRIEAHAKATSSDETNRNLILSEDAKADSIPFLEILTSDVVACGHHSSVGQLDEMQLFYLESRGIPRPDAARLLVFGFFAEVLERIDIDAVAETLLGEIEGELKDAPTLVMDQRRDHRRVTA